ncbi:hypothetical protein DERP_001341 [Dermatophagoides pteronyssinus]|uniref:Uncharacterized protein n=1 Tax=Dermatophagoides pteronyssinus TaxID=6956 RepID=A0ABQ8JE58_DERPT|nr:hypothetical protein DERP_001341 [Dermatophagoides pteronyssinus]
MNEIISRLIPASNLPASINNLPFDYFGHKSDPITSKTNFDLEYKNKETIRRQQQLPLLNDR